MFGIICIAFDDTDEAYRLGELSLLLHDRCSNDTSLGCFFMNYSFLRPLRKPSHGCIDPLWSAYNLGTYVSEGNIRIE